MIWSSNKNNPPYYTPIANGVIEHLLEDGYFLIVFWCDDHIIGRRVIINISKKNAIFTEFPDRNVGSVIHAPWCTQLTATSVDGNRKLVLDATNPQSLQLISKFFKEIDPER